MGIIHIPNGSHVESIKVDIKPYFLAATSRDTIIVGDLINRALQIVDNRGNVLHTLHPLGHVSFWRPRGICHPHDQSIFICNSDAERDNHEISCFSVDGEYLRSIPVKCNPMGIIFAKEGHRLLVTSDKCVHVYTQ